MSDTPPILLPPIVRAQWEQPPPSTGPWQKTILLAYGGVFIWAPFFDQLWVGAIGSTSTFALLASALAALAVAFGIFYLPMATWGQRSRQRLGVVAASTFGTLGSEWITGLGVAALEILWYALTFDFTVDATMLGLECLGLLDRAAWDHPTLGGFSVRSPVFLLTAWFWIFILRTAYAIGLSSVLVALMKFYNPIALALLTAIAAPMLGGFLQFRPRYIESLSLGSGFSPAGANASDIFTRILGFFAIVGLMSVDWGLSARRTKDVVIGGLTGIVAVGSWVCLMSLIIVTGAVARLANTGSVIVDTANRPMPFSFRWAIFHAVGGPIGGTVLILFALASLAPACYAIELYAGRMNAHWPLRRKWLWGWLGGVPVIVLIALGWSQSIWRIEELMGLIPAPVLGAMAADMATQRGAWTGVRPGLNPSGLLAVAAGLSIGPAFSLLDTAIPGFAHLIPAALAGFTTSALVYGALQASGLQPRTIRLEPFMPQDPTIAQPLEPPRPVGTQDAR